jgi:spore coat polysaccharide biosynthesis protein SpsF
MPYLYDHPGRFKVLVKHHDPDYGNKRWTVDTPQDLEFVRSVYDHFSPNINFSWNEVIDLVKEYPDLEKINETINAKNVVDVDNRYNEGDK